MTIPEYIQQLKQTQIKLESQQEFEICYEISKLIQSIETQDIKSFMHLCFDIKVMKKVGYFGKKDTAEQMAERVKHTFGHDNVFQYAVRQEMWCPFYRYANGVYDTRKKVLF